MPEPTPADFDFLVIGECVADIVRTPGHPDRPHPGGSPANVAHGLARLGRRTALLTQLGTDPYGELIRTHLEAGGTTVLTDGRDVPTPSAIVTLDPSGSGSYRFAIDWTLAPTAAAPRARHVHLGSLASVQEPGAAVARRLLRGARAAGATVSYDPNVRPDLFGERSAAVAAVEHCVALSDLVKASDEDLAFLYPGVPVRDSAARWLTLGPGTVVVTRGGDGAFALTPEGETRTDAPPTTVVDTVGAGDSFMSALLAALDTPRPGLDALTAALRTAAAAAAVTVSRAGANPPTAAELAARRADLA
ncbi:ribokinase [Kitasatospora phosalacinea]|uniref:Ribokinase n=1 Tax=Kitasatospora phosalacinea TaxID=2065 RepID=A0A9W6QCU1_9ACTN|nr:carbohydrate kinase [Kitasatospora phosalacinea]GLW72658.1 ribokinase [Kitasatospora phosalacinea]